MMYELHSTYGSEVFAYGCMMAIFADMSEKAHAHAHTRAIALRTFAGAREVIDLNPLKTLQFYSQDPISSSL